MDTLNGESEGQSADVYCSWMNSFVKRCRKLRFECRYCKFALSGIMSQLLLHGLVHIKVALEDPLLELVGDVDWLGVVSDRSVHDGDALRASVSPAASWRGSRHA